MAENEESKSKEPSPKSNRIEYLENRNNGVNEVLDSYIDSNRLSYDKIIFSSIQRPEYRGNKKEQPRKDIALPKIRLRKSTNKSLDIDRIKTTRLRYLNNSVEVVNKTNLVPRRLGNRHLSKRGMIESTFKKNSPVINPEPPTKNSSRNVFDRLINSSRKSLD